MKPRAPERILMATDLGPASDSALRFAGALASSLGARLVLFHAVAPMVFFDFGAWDARYVQLAAEKQADKSAEELQKIRSNLLPDSIDVEIEVRDTNPVQGIIAIAQEKQCELIVLGTHAWGPITSFFLGSVTQGVLHQSDIPVITVRPREDTGGPWLRKILCPVNISEAAYASLLYASMLAEKSEAELEILHLAEPDGERTSHSIGDWLPADISSAEIHTITRTGHVSEKVIQHAQQHDFDMIVVGAQHKRFLDTTVLGTTTERIIHHAPCAVMAVTMKAVEESQRESGAA